MTRLTSRWKVVQVGILPVHGYTGTPPEMYLIGDCLSAREITVRAPPLPGRGTAVEEIDHTKWTDWAGHCQEASDRLKNHCAAVYASGLSMGALITLYPASRNHNIAGAVIYSPAVIIADRMIYLTTILEHFIKMVPKSSDSDLVDPAADAQLWSYPNDPPLAAHELLKLSQC